MPDNLPIETHKEINRELCGTPMKLAAGESLVTLDTTKAMTVDSTGLVHGGFVFGLADHAAMLAVNHPYVVLASSNCQFLKPVRPGEHLIAEATVIDENGRKRTVRVFINRDDTRVFSGEFICVVLEKHVLE